MKILDLFCCAGGASSGYFRAGFEVVGVDINPQPNYPYTFVQGDAIEFLIKYGKDFDAIHASPPCQHYTKLKTLSVARNGNNSYGSHPELIEPVRALLQNSGKPYIIENVPGAPLINPISLSGSQFGLKTQRKRNFECSFSVDLSSLPPRTKMQTPSVGRGVGPDGSISICGNGGVKGLKSVDIPLVWSNALGGVSWMTRAEMAECIPPAYTEFLGIQLMNHIIRIQQDNN